MRKAIIGIVGSGITTSIIRNFAQSNKDIEIVQVTESFGNPFAPEPITYNRPPMIEEPKIFYDKQGKPLTNVGSKFHK